MEIVIFSIILYIRNKRKKIKPLNIGTFLKYKVLTSTKIPTETDNLGLVENHPIKLKTLHLNLSKNRTALRTFQLIRMATARVLSSYFQYIEKHKILLKKTIYCNKKYLTKKTLRQTYSECIPPLEASNRVQIVSLRLQRRFSSTLHCTKDTTT